MIKPRWTTVERPGRPTRKTQLEIQQTLREYFDLGITATLAAKEADINIKTVSKYFTEFAEQIEEKEKQEFTERYKTERIRAINSFDWVLLRAKKLLDSIQIQKENPSAQILSLELQTLRFISYIIEKKAGVNLQPTIDDSLKNQISEMLKNNENN